MKDSAARLVSGQAFLKSLLCSQCLTGDRTMQHAVLETVSIWLSQEALRKALKTLSRCLIQQETYGRNYRRCLMQG